MDDTLNPYFDDDNKPILRQSAIAYLDLLGFSNMLSEAAGRGIKDEQNLLIRLSAALNRARQYVNDIRPKHGHHALSAAKAFTDNLIYAYPFIDQGQWEVTDVLFNIGHYQRELAIDGFFTRGGVAIGHIHVSENIVFGMPLLEAKKSDIHGNPPRVVLCQSAIKYIEEHDDLQHLDRAISKGQNGEYFLNFLQALDGPDYDGSRLQELEKIKEVIELGVESFANEQNICEKYLWTAKYFNNFCRESQFNLGITNIRIPYE